MDNSVTELEEGKEGALTKWTKWATKKSESLRSEYGDIRQSTTDILTSYTRAFKVYKHYNEIMESIARQTDGEFDRAPVKRLFRAIEKTALRKSQSMRYQCDNL